MEKNKQWLALCCLEIEKTLGWGAASGWRNEDFEQVAEKIFDRTGTRLSLSTMKRIWGRVRYDNFPGTATLNALAQFTGYTNWRQFCEQHPVEEIKIVQASSLAQQDNQYKPDRKLALLVSGLVITGAIGLLAARHYSIQAGPVKRNYNYQFSSRKTADDLPNSVVFTYDAGTGKDDKVMIQQSWDSSRREPVDPLGHQHTSIYYYPGYFKAKLMVGDSIVKQTPVFIQTKGWKAIAGREPLPVYFNDTAMRKKNGIAISPSQFATAIGSTDLNNRWLQFVNMRSFTGIEGRNLIFQTTLRNTAAVEQSLCRKVRVIILCTENPLIIELSSKGCIADLNLYTGDSSVSGRNHDLSALGCDFSVPQDLVIAISDHILRLSLNGKMALSYPVVKSLGNIVGVRILFEGGGEINHALLSSPGGASYDLMKLP